MAAATTAVAPYASRVSKRNEQKYKYENENEKWKESFAAAIRCFPRILGEWCLVFHFPCVRVAISFFFADSFDLDAEVLLKRISRQWLQFDERRYATRSIRIIRFTSVRIEVKVRRPKTMGFRTASKSWNCSKQKSGSTSDMLRVNWLSLLSFSHRRLPADARCIHVKVLQRPNRFADFDILHDDRVISVTCSSEAVRRRHCNVWGVLVVGGKSSPDKNWIKILFTSDACWTSKN